MVWSQDGNARKNKRKSNKHTMLAAKRQHQPKPCPLWFLNQGLWVRAPSLTDIHRGWCRSYFYSIVGWRSQPFLTDVSSANVGGSAGVLRKECLRCNPTEGSCIYAICLKPGGLVIGYRKANSSYDWGYAIQRTYIGIRGLWQKLAKLCWSSFKGTVFPISQLHTM